MCEVKGERVVSDSVAQRWFQHINTGEENTKDLPRSGRPKLWDIENIRRALEENPQEALVGCQTNLVHQKIHPQIKTLGKSYRSCKSVPHELTREQVQLRVDICRQLISNPMDDRFIRRIVTCDENWVYYHNPGVSKQGSVPVKLLKLRLKKSVRPQSNVCLVEF